LESIDGILKARLDRNTLLEIINSIPEEWLLWEGSLESPQQIREVYFNFLTLRMAHSEIFVKEARDARKMLI
jgi:hypothetical protein